MENFGELFSPKFITFYACARIRNKDASKTRALLSKPAAFRGGSERTFPLNELDDVTGDDRIIVLILIIIVMRRRATPRESTTVLGDNGYE